MTVIAVQKYTDAKVHIITVGNRELFWAKMIDVQNGLGIKNISDLMRKSIQGIYKTRNPTEEQTRKYKCSQKEISKEPTDDSKFKYAHSDLMEKIIKNCRGVKRCNECTNRMEKEEQRGNFRILLGFRGNDIMKREEYSITSQIEKVFANEKIEPQHFVLRKYHIDF